MLHDSIINTCVTISSRNIILTGNMVDKNRNNDAGGGMSRAALKKKKKRKQQQQLEVSAKTVDSMGGATSVVAATGTIPEKSMMASIQPSMKHGKVQMDTTQTKKRKKSESSTTPNDGKFGIIDDDDILIEGDHHDHDDDEEIPMKKSANENDSESLIPKEIHTLHDLLLLPNSDATENRPSNHNNNNDTSTVVSNMTIEQRAQCALEFLLQPSFVSKTMFYSKYYEKLPLHVHGSTKSSGHNMSNQQQQHRQRFENIFGISDIRDMIQNNTLYYGTDLNVTRYEKSNDTDGVYRRITLDKKKKKGTGDSDDPTYEVVKSDEVWDLYNNQKCTIRLLCPQQYNDTIHALLSLLEHEFHCMVGANIYCTPPNSAQGFAPHYDDIDAYIVQLEGYKRWKVYKPMQTNERLPRTSSRDYTTQDLVHIEPVLDIVLGPGDLLYMPRGWIHQACTIPSSKNASDDDDDDDDDNNNNNKNQPHSLHLTISTMQQWAWADYMEILLPEALQATIQSSTTVLLREGLPNGFLQYMGAMYDNRTELLPDILQAKMKTSNRMDDINEANRKAESEDGTSTLDGDDDYDMLQQQQQRQVLQEEFRTQTKRRLMRVVKEAMTMIDAACDQMGKRFLSERLPPALTESERCLTNACTTVPQVHHTLAADTLCQIVRPGIARLVLEDAMAVVYHCNDNSRVYQEFPISPLEFEMDDAPSIEQLLTTTPPHWIAIEDLIHDTIDDKVSIAQALYDEGILAIRR